MKRERQETREKCKKCDFRQFDYNGKDSIAKNGK